MKETEKAYGVLMVDDTMEVISNDRQLKIAIVKSRVIQDGEINEFYRSVYWVKDGLEWERVSESQNYKTADEFLSAIEGADDFTLAVADIKRQKEECQTTD